MSQAQQIREYLMAGNSLTPIEALSLFNCMTLSQRVTDLKNDGDPIDRDMVRTPSGKRVASYYWRVPFSE